MEELAVNIKIGGRAYPMKVKPVDEGRVRAAGKLINERINTYSKQFGIQDQQDLLAMVAFDCLTQTMRIEEEETQHMTALIDQIDTLVQLVEQALP